MIWTKDRFLLSREESESRVKPDRPALLKKKRWGRRNGRARVMDLSKGRRASFFSAQVWSWRWDGAKIKLTWMECPNTKGGELQDIVNARD